MIGQVGGVQPLRRVFYDCEFLEEGSWKPIELISIGMVDDQGRSYHAVVDDAVRDYGQGGSDLYTRIRSHPWLRDNVVPHLERTPAHQVLDRVTIADDALSFIRGGLPAETKRDQIELWSWFGAYDHVVLCQLFGTMSDLPHPVPMFTCDLQQEARRLGFDEDELLGLCHAELPAHDALFDAETHRRMYRMLAEHQACAAEYVYMGSGE